MSGGVKSLYYAAIALVLVVWSFARPSMLPLLLPVGLALVTGFARARRDGRSARPAWPRPTDQDITEVQSRYPGGV